MTTPNPVIVFVLPIAKSANRRSVEDEQLVKLILVTVSQIESLRQM